MSEETKTTKGTVILDAEGNNMLLEEEGPTAGEIIDDLSNLPPEVMSEGQGIIDKLLAPFQQDGVMSRMIDVNKEAGLDVVGGKIAHVSVRSVQHAVIGLIPDETPAGKFMRSKLMDALMYSLLSQGVVFGANQMTSVHERFELIAKGAARNSIKYSANALGLVGKLSTMAPALQKFFN